jgi:hypothetical protein
MLFGGAANPILAAAGLKPALFRTVSPLQNRDLSLDRKEAALTSSRFPDKLIT